MNDDRGTYAFLGALCLLVAAWMFLLLRDKASYPASGELSSRFFEVQSIDTMKFSRDLAREKMSDRSFDAVIDAQMRSIRETGATHAAIGTPYDAEFLPVLERWVLAARRNGLSVWFRGNFSGWEGWFGYARIGEAEHTRLLSEFLDTRAYLFENGDIFSPCPECENGGPGDPRSNGRTEEYNQFLADEYLVAKSSFDKAGKDVKVYSSMNADIARDILTPSASDDIGNVVLVDHYVGSAEAFSRDITDIRKILRSAVGVGEFGAPVPDIHGDMNEAEQARFIEESLEGLIGNGTSVPLVNYWVLQGGSTALINSDGSEREAYSVVKSYFSPRSIEGFVTGTNGKGIGGVTVLADGSAVKTQTRKDGSYRLLAPNKDLSLRFEKDAYAPERAVITTSTGTSTADVVLEKIDPGFFDRIF